MSWRDQLKPASYRGVAFHSGGESEAFGPQYTVHTYPLKSKPYTEYMGDKPKEYTINAFVMGEDYHTQRDKLKAALNQVGPAQLVHPKYGRLTVVPIRIRLRETPREGGVCRFDITFVEYGGLPQPEQKVDTFGQAIDAASAVKKQAVIDAIEQYQVLDIYQGEAVNRTLDLVTLTEDLTGRLNAAGQGVDDINLAVTELVNDAVNIISHPPRLVASIAALVTNIITASDSIEFALSAYDNLADLFPRTTPSEFDSPSRKQYVKNGNALGELVRNIAIADVVAQTVTAAKALDVVTNDTSPFDSVNQAVAVRDRISAGINQARANAGDIQRNHLLDLRATLFAHITAHGMSLASIQTYHPAAAMPVQNLAYLLYGDLEKANDIIRRNGIANPLAISGDVEVLKRSDTRAKS